MRTTMYTPGVVVRRGRRGVVGFIHVPVSVKASAGAVESYSASFLVDTGAMDSVVPARELRRIGIEPIATETFELADGSVRVFAFGLAHLDVMRKVTGGRVLFGPDGIEPLLGVAPLQSAGFTVDPTNHTLRTVRLRL
jgi:predicted aspartyl protease